MMDYANVMNFADYSDMGNFWPFAAFAAMSVFFVVAMIVVGIVLYVLFSIGLMKLAQNKGIENAWLAWIPFGQLYIMGKIIGTFKIFDREVPQAELWLPVGLVIAMVASSIPIVLMLVPGAVAIVTIFSFYKLFSLYRPEKATLYTLLGTVIAVVMPVLVFVIRNDEPVA